MANKTLYIKPFYATANRLLRAKINTIEDVRKFYIGVNELASEIALNSILISELDSVKYGDNQKLIKGITHILGYGQVIGKYKDLFTAKEVKLNAFLKKNPRFRNGIGIIQKEARIYFNTLSKRVGELERRDKEKDETIAELKKDVELTREIKEAVKSIAATFPPDRVFKVELVGNAGGFSGETGASHKGKEARISYNTNLGKFTFNDAEDVFLEGNQKDVADCLTEHGKESKVSWDELFERIGDNKGPSNTDAEKRVVRTAVGEINKNTGRYLPMGKKLIVSKNNEYWLQYEVDKGR